VHIYPHHIENNDLHLLNIDKFQECMEHTFYILMISKYHLYI